jgi:hypothetical protein
MPLNWLKKLSVVTRVTMNCPLSPDRISSFAPGCRPSAFRTRRPYFFTASVKTSAHLR